MAGHSQFKNIMHRKGRQDAMRSKMFSKLAREITVAAKMGTPDPDMNPRLRLAINAAKAQSMPKDNIQRAIDKAAGAEGGVPPVDAALASAVQVIDEFAITTRYSPQTGRPEPMVTVGKRITDRVRLSAATGLTGEERTFQTGLEWRVGDQTSIQASYDNLNRESASSFGNLGVDFRWRLEFE